MWARYENGVALRPAAPRLKTMAEVLGIGDPNDLLHVLGQATGDTEEADRNTAPLGAA
jgi:hypothetical protein